MSTAHELTGLFVIYGKVYPSLGVTMPLVAIRYRRQIEALGPQLAA